MKSNKIFIILSTVSIMMGCTKLDTKLHDSLSPNLSGGTSLDPQALLNSTYNSLQGPLNNQDQIFSLMENVTDECLVPTRGGDWDDNGVWRVLHLGAHGARSAPPWILIVATMWVAWIACFAGIASILVTLP